MDGLLSFLLFAAFFYMMMRHGCGAHHVNGDVDHVDPVCGMKVSSTNGYGMMHQGKLYRFCSRGCLDRFEAEPDKYIQNTTPKEVHHE